MYIRKTELKDIHDVVDIYHQASAYLKSKGINQWQNNYPNENSLRTDISNESSYVIEDEGKVIGSACIIQFEDPYYQVIEGNWLTHTPYVVIHRICVSNEIKGKKIANLFFEKALEVAKDRKVDSIRIDTHEQNLSMQKWISNNGFTYCGIVHVADNAKRLAYEYMLED